MIEEIRKVEPLVSVLGITAEVNLPDAIYLQMHGGFDVREGRALRDWLTQALPCDHLFFTGSRRLDPFGKSDGLVEVKNECTKCGFVADGGGEYGD